MEITAVAECALDTPFPECEHNSYSLVNYTPFAPGVRFSSEVIRTYVVTHFLLVTAYSWYVYVCCAVSGSFVYFIISGAGRDLSIWQTAYILWLGLTREM